MNPVLQQPAARAATLPGLLGPYEVDFPFHLAPRRPSLAALATCRALNVVAAVVLLVLTLPIMLVVAVLVKLSSPGPVLYTQTRVGLDRRAYRNGSGGSVRRRVDYGGRLFTIYKFRTMRADSSSEAQVWASPDDERVTRVGRVLRKYRLDELPQLWNVLKGDMNVVGPRPEQPRIVLALREQIIDYPRRQRVRPGITGLAQVSQTYDTCVDDVRSKLRYDLEYIDRLSPLQDLAILLRTVPVVLLRKGAW